MAERRTLVEGLMATPAIDPEIEKQFVYRKTNTASPQTIPTKVTNPGTVARTPLSTRLRTDLAEALKRASLQRQLDKTTPSSLTEILEAAVEPWLKEHGYLN